MAVLSRQALLEAKTHDRVPPKEFMEKLRTRDPDLDVWWDNVIGRWQLVRWYDFEGWTTSPLGLRYRVCRRQWDPVATLQYTDGSFMPLGDAVFRYLDAADTHQVDMAEYIRRKDQIEEEAKQRQLDSAGEDMAAWVKDHRNQYNRWKTGQPVIPHHRTYRSITKATSLTTDTETPSDGGTA